MYWLYDTDDFVIEYMRPILQHHAICLSQDVSQYSIALFWVGLYSSIRVRIVLGNTISEIRNLRRSSMGANSGRWHNVSNDDRSILYYDVHYVCYRTVGKDFENRNRSIIFSLMKANAASQSKKTRGMTKQLMKALMCQVTIHISRAQLIS